MDRGTRLTRLLRYLRLAAVCGASATALSACALMDRQVRLTYPPSEPADAPPTMVASGGSVSLSVTDARTGDRVVVGHVRNGLYMPTADVTTTDDAAGWVRTALEQELGAAGLRVVPAGPGTTAVDARLVGLACDAYFSYSAEVLLQTTLAGPGGSQSSRVTGQGGAGMNWTATEAAYGESLALALRDAARQVAASASRAVAPTAAPHP